MNRRRRPILATLAAVGMLLAGLVLGYLLGLRGSDADAPMPRWALPFAAGQSWMAGGPHADGQDASKPFNALDFAPLANDGQVRSMAAGKVYRIECDRGFYLGVEHAGGWRSTYYHLVNQQTALLGSTVPAGTHLGDVGTALPCGGLADGPHVHVAIYHNTRPVPVDAVRFGDYRAFSTGVNYGGYWLDGDGSRVLGTTRNLQCCLRFEKTTSIPSPSP